MDKKLAELIRETKAIKDEMNRLEQRFDILLDKIVALAPDTSMPPVDKKLADKTVPKTTKKVTSAQMKASMVIGRKKYNLTELKDALRLNNLAVIEDLRNSLAKIAGQQHEKQLLAELIAAGIPGVILTGTLKAAIIDGSNIAQMAKSSVGKLSYIESVKTLAHKNGYFPVITIVDASLRHHIDKPEQLGSMVESGEIIMAPPYTSADELIISEARRQDAVVLTNDKFNDWPDAKNISKRHVAINDKTLSLGNFHRATSFWFR